MKKRITSVVLVFCMLFTMIGVTGAVAADTADTDVVITVDFDDEFRTLQKGAYTFENTLKFTVTISGVDSASEFIQCVGPLYFHWDADVAQVPTRTQGTRVTPLVTQNSFFGLSVVKADTPGELRVVYATAGDYIEDEEIALTTEGYLQLTDDALLHASTLDITVSTSGSAGTTGVGNADDVAGGSEHLYTFSIPQTQFSVEIPDSGPEMTGVEVSGDLVEYDGQVHNIAVTGDPKGSAIAYAYYGITLNGTKNAGTYKVISTDENVSVVEDSLISDTDYSDLNVNVIKDTNGQQITIYSGALSGYADGTFSNMDFSEINFMVILDWNTMEDEAIYIIPIDKVENNLHNIISADEIVSLMNVATTSSLDSTFEVNAIFWNSNGYDEYIVENKNVLGVDLKVKNNSNSSEIIQPFFALYENGKLLEAKMLSSQTVGAGNEVVYAESINVNGNDTEKYTAKVFNWAEGSLKPLSNSVAISGNKVDFFGNNITNATLIQDLEKEVKGTINTSNDVDYLEIVSNSTNTYSLKTFSTSNVVGTLYNSSGTALVSTSTSIDYTLILC